MVTFQDVYDTFKEKGCLLLIQKDEFDKSNHKVKEKYNYIASCGHEHEVWLNVFKNRGTGIICPKCMITKHSKHRKETFKEHPNKLSDLEYESIQFFRKHTKDSFDIKLTREGCLVNIALKPKNVLEDMWLMIHIKSTFKPSRDYAFKCGSEYANCVILCICQSDKRIWALDGNNINVSDKIAIGLKKSKYSQYEVSLDNVCETFNSFYNLLPNYSFDIINTPVSQFQQLEVKFIKHRELKVPLDYIYQEKYGLVYDFMLNGLRVQEKVGHTAEKKKGTLFPLHKNNGKNGKTSYKKGDADFYWLNCPNKKHFYIIPETLLIEYEYINTLKANGLYLNPYTNNKPWAKEYLFDYDQVDIDKIKTMFKIDS